LSSQPRPGRRPAWRGPIRGARRRLLPSPRRPGASNQAPGATARTGRAARYVRTSHGAEVNSYF